MTLIEIWLLGAPFAALTSVYCWDYGMELLLPTES